MGRIFLRHIGGTRLFSCASCDTPLTNRAELISTRFTGMYSTSMGFGIFIPPAWTLQGRLCQRSKSHHDHGQISGDTLSVNSLVFHAPSLCPSPLKQAGHTDIAKLSLVMLVPMWVDIGLQQVVQPITGEPLSPQTSNLAHWCTFMCRWSLLLGWWVIQNQGTLYQ